MPRKTTVSNEARSKVLFELSKHDKGLVLTKLAQNLSWKRTDTKRVLNDLEFSGMVFVDDLAHWSFSRQKGRGLVDFAYLFEISPKGLTFLKHWEAIKKLNSTKGVYSKYRMIIEGPPSKLYTETELEYGEY